MPEKYIYGNLKSEIFILNIIKIKLFKKKQKKFQKTIDNQKKKKYII